MQDKNSFPQDLLRHDPVDLVKPLHAHIKSSVLVRSDFVFKDYSALDASSVAIRKKTGVVRINPCQTSSRIRLVRVNLCQTSSRA